MRNEFSNQMKIVGLRQILAILILLSLPITCFSNENGKTHSDSDLTIKLGERIFNGLLPIGDQKKACASCHTDKVADTINWNPSFREVALKTKLIGIKGLEATLHEPNGKLLEVVHNGYKLKEEQLAQLYTFLTQEDNFEKPTEKPRINKILIFLLLGLLMTAAIIDLFFTKKIRYKAIHLLIIVLGVGVQAQLLIESGVNMGRSQNYMPDQPVKFSHKVHSGDNKIDCMYCHSDVEKGKSAGIPSTSVCMNCHVIVREGTNSGKFEIAKVVASMDSAKSIEWIRVHSLPDHVFFDHSQHVKVGKLACKECHGDVENMDILKQEKDLSMGWCIDCHRTKNVKIGENGYYKHTFAALQKAGKDSISVARMGGEDCMKCHY
jgi:hypothetical protein